jgi:hypothetical protein
MGMILAAYLISAVPPTVEVRTAVGQTISGTLMELDSQHLSIEAAGKRTQWTLDDLIAIEVKSPKGGPSASPPISVEMVDASTVAAEAFSTDTARAQVALPGGRRLECAGEDVKSVRFMQPTEAAAAQWSRMAKEPSTADLLVVKKGESIDYHKGVIGAVTAETVDFAIDGERLAVKRAKVFGLVYRRSSGREIPESKGLAVETNGSVWAVASIRLAGDQLEWTTPLGIKMSRPIGSLARLDFSRGKVIYLSDLTPESVQWVPYFSAGKETPAQVSLFAPRKDRSLESGPLQLDSIRYSKGLAIHSRTTLVYRLPDRYRRFSAVVGIDDLVRPQGNVRLVISGDDRVLLEIMVGGAEPARRVDLDMTAVRRLTIVADFGDDFDVGDHLDLCDARLLK